GEAGSGPGVSHDPDLDRQGHQERPQAAGVRAVGAPVAHRLLPEVEEGVQRIQAQRRLVPAGDPLLRRGREGELDADPDPRGRPAPAGGEPVHEGVAGEQVAVSARHLRSGIARAWIGAGFAAALLGAAGTAGAQDKRPSEEEMFGGAPATLPAPAQAAPPAAPPAPSSDVATPAPPAPGPVSAPPPPGAGPAAAASSQTRDQTLLGNPEAGPQLSTDVAPEDPLTIGGQLYLRAQSTIRENTKVGGWGLSSPNLLDVYFDARPNERVRGFVLGRVGFDPTAAPALATGDQISGTAMGAPGNLGSSATGFTTFNPSRGPNAVLDQMWMSFDIEHAVFVTAGKQHVRWGSGRFW